MPPKNKSLASIQDVKDVLAAFGNPGQLTQILESETFKDNTESTDVGKPKPTNDKIRDKLHNLKEQVEQSLLQLDLYQLKIKIEDAIHDNRRGELLKEQLIEINKLYKKCY